MTTSHIGGRKVTSFVTMGFLLLGLSTLQAMTTAIADGSREQFTYDQNGQSLPTATPFRTVTPVPTVTPSATPVSTPVSTPLPTVSPNPTTSPAATPVPSAAAAASPFPGLGSAGKYAVLSLTGTFQNQSTLINGNVGIGPNSLATSQSSSVVNGNVYYDPSTRYAGL